MSEHPGQGQRLASSAGLWVAAFLVFLGTAWAFQRGANDFSVFYQAWRLVLEGRGSEIYSATPDRFLYAPGFAWVLSPLGLLPRELALALWCLAKAAALALTLRAFTRANGKSAVGWFAAAWIARPLLIDFQYGQVNTFILAACAWALVSHFRAGSTRSEAFWAWFALGIAGACKLFPLPLVILPWVLPPAGTDKGDRIRRERAGVIAGLALVALVPLVTQGWSGNLTLVGEWKQALINRGMPGESHNQSFAALLEHYLSGEPTHVISQGAPYMRFGSAVLSPEAIHFISLAWTVMSLSLLLGWLLSSHHRTPIRWAAVAIGLLIVPSHLIWKPYFVLSLPLAAVALQDAARAHGRSRAWRWVALALVFAAMNLTSFDFVGYAWAARLEAACVMLAAHLTLLGLVIAA